MKQILNPVRLNRAECRYVSGAAPAPGIHAILHRWRITARIVKQMQMEMCPRRALSVALNARISKARVLPHVAGI